MEAIATGKASPHLSQVVVMASRTKKIPAQPTPDPKKFKCDVKGCDYIGGSKSVVTRHWNQTHRKPHAQKRGTRKRNQDTGRPTVVTSNVTAKLVAAFQNGLSKKQAIRYAGISKDAYYAAIKRDEEFATKMSDAQWKPNMKAREVVVRAIEAGDVKAAEWWLERREKDEFTLRRETTGAGGGAVKFEASKPKSLSLEELHDAVLGDA